MALEAKNVSFRYGRRGPFVLEDVSLRVERGERVALFAPSGRGKTTLALLLAGYARPQSGQILLEGKPLPETGVGPVQLIWQHPEKATNPRWRLRRVLEALDALGGRGYAPDGELVLYLVPERCDMDMVFNAYTILDARRQLVEMALGLREEVQLVVGRDLAFSLPLDAFSIPAIEACACLLVQVCAMAASTRKARMKPCDMSNPRYQMRSWLLRLGFIGERFARPRQTLLEPWAGNAAFFDDAGRQKAKEKRQRKKAMALA